MSVSQAVLEGVTLNGLYGSALTIHAGEVTLHCAHGSRQYPVSDIVSAKLEEWETTEWCSLRIRMSDGYGIKVVLPNQFQARRGLDIVIGSLALAQNHKANKANDRSKAYA